MPCPRCGGERLPFPVPADLRPLFPDDRPGATVCTHCLHVDPVDDPPDDLPAFASISDAFPRRPAHAVSVVCLLALLDSIALYREEIDAVTDRAESEGTDVLLVLDRLAADPDVDPYFDLEKRSHQLQQFLA